MQWATLPSECRQRKDPYLAPWGDRGGKASTSQGPPLEVLIPLIVYMQRGYPHEQEL